MGDVSSYELCIQFGTLYLVNVDLNVLVSELHQLLLENLNLSALLADDDTGASGADGDGDELERALDDDACDTGLSAKTLIEILADLVVLNESISGCLNDC